MNLHWRKVIGDFRSSLGRMLLVSLAIMTGIVAITTTFGASAILDRELQASYESTHPSAITVWLDSVDSKLVEQVTSLPGVKDAEARRVVQARAELSPGNWQRLWMFGVEDFQNLRVSTFQAESGEYPPKDGALLIERSTTSVLQSELGKPLRVRTPSDIATDLVVSGTVHDPGLAPGWMDNLGYAYATPKTLEMLGEGEFLDELRITISDCRGSKQACGRPQATQLATTISEWLTSNGYSVRRIEVPLRQHVHSSQMDAMMGLLRSFSLVAIALSGVLAANVITALVARQIRQIGIMKAMGATTTQIFNIYLRFVLLLSVAPVVFGILIGAMTGQQFATSIAAQLNVDISNQTIPLWLFGLEAILGLSVPIVSATVPILKAARTTAHDAIHSTDIQFSPQTPQRLPLTLPVTRPLILSFRNSFRRPVRLGLTIATLAIAGALLMTCLNVYRSLNAAMDQSLEMRGDDIEFRLLNPAPADRLINQTLKVPNVEAAEVWGMTLAAIELSNSPVSTERYNLFAPPNDTQLFQWQRIEGRPIAKNEQGAVIINGGLLNREHSLSLRVGSKLVIKSEGRRTPVQVVGILEEVGEFAMYTNAQTLAAITGNNENAANLRVVTTSGRQSQVAKALEQSLVESGWFPTSVMTHADVKQAMTDHFLILLVVLSGTALAVVVVGGLGLATTMSLNVLERSREIGIMRAMGATQNTILKIFLLEGSSITTLSVVTAILLSIPLSVAVGTLLGKVGLQVQLPFIISIYGIFIWLGLATITTIIACWLPAQSALRLPVSDVLAHE